MDKKKKFPWSILIAALNILVLVYIALREENLPEALATFAKLNPVWGAAAFLAMAGYLALEGLCFHVAIRRCGMGLTFGASLRCSLTARFYTLATPAGIGGQPAFIAMCVREGGNGATAGAAASVRYIGYQIGYMATTALCLFMFGGRLSAGLRFGLVTGLLFNLGLPALLLVFLRWPQAGRWMAWKLSRIVARLRLYKDPDGLRVKLLDTVNDFNEGVRRAGYRSLLVIALIGIFETACAGAVVPFICLAFGVATDFLPLCALTIILMVAISAMPTPGNTGAAEGGFYSAFGPYFGQALFPAMLLWRVVQYYMPLIVGAIAMFARPRRNP